MAKEIETGSTYVLLDVNGNLFTSSNLTQWSQVSLSSTSFQQVNGITCSGSECLILGQFSGSKALAMKTSNFSSFNSVYQLSNSGSIFHNGAKLDGFWVALGVKGNGTAYCRGWW